MCGIGGFSGKYTRQEFRALKDRLAHRGPDGTGTIYLPSRGLGLGHTRLAIIDLDARANQPMWDISGRAAIAFNGEIYNYGDLRLKLKEKGHCFRTTSDTEVVLAGYVEWGDDILTRLEGMFAFALWDDRDRRLLVARDGFGVKPLYWTTTPRGFVFASELKALLTLNDVSRAVDHTALEQYVSLLWSPGTRTPFSSIHKLEPGHCLEVRDGRVVANRKFYELPVGSVAHDPRDAGRQVRAALAEAVRRQLVSDVEVGAFLSGGLDSSAIVALAEEQDRRGEGRQCFTMAASSDLDTGAGFVADLPYARRMAERLQVTLHEVHTSDRPLIDQLSEAVWHLDEPQADPAVLSTGAIAAAARQAGIKVLLSGAGADDLFAGYRRHLALAHERWWSWLPQPVRRGLSTAGSHIPTSSPLGRRGARMLRAVGGDPTDRIVDHYLWIDRAEARALFASDVRHALDGADPTFSLRTTLAGLPPSTPRLDQMLAVDVRHFLADHNLNYTDKMAMAHGVEVRVPFLDRDLAACAFSLPPRLKQRGRTGKWILRQALQGDLPPDILHRPKTGFGGPLRSWLAGPLRGAIDERLSPATLRRRGLFEPAAVQRLKTQHYDGRRDNSYTLLSVLMIELWCEQFLDRRWAGSPG